MAKIAKKILGLSMFYWGLIVLVVLFFFSGMGRVSEGFAMKKRCDDPKTKTNDVMKQCLLKPKSDGCKWKDDTCYCCP